MKNYITFLEWTLGGNSDKDLTEKNFEKKIKNDLKNSKKLNKNVAKSS